MVDMTVTVCYGKGHDDNNHTQAAAGYDPAQLAAFAVTVAW